MKKFLFFFWSIFLNVLLYGQTDSAHVFSRGLLYSGARHAEIHDSTWIEDKVDTIKTQWVIVADKKGVLKKKWLKEVVYKYKKINHTLIFYQRPEENIINRKYYINGKVVDLIAYQLLDRKYKSVFFNYE